MQKSKPSSKILKPIIPKNIVQHLQHSLEAKIPFLTKKISKLQLQQKNKKFKLEPFNQTHEQDSMKP